MQQTKKLPPSLLIMFPAVARQIHSLNCSTRPFINNYLVRPNKACMTSCKACMLPIRASRAPNIQPAQLAPKEWQHHTTN